VKITAFLLMLAWAGVASAEPLLVHNGRLFVPARVNGVATEALLDSAAEASLIDPQLAAAAHFPEGQEITIRGSGGNAKARVVEGVSIELLGQKIPVEAVVVTDLKDISERLVKRSTRAVVGREAFDALRLAIDIQGGTIGLGAAAPTGVKLPLTAHAGVESVPVTVGAMPAQAEFDLGNGSEVMVSRAFSRMVGLKLTGRKSGGGIGGEVVRDTTVLPLLKVAGVAYRDVPATIDDQPNANDLNVGTSILRNFLITTDFKQRVVWLRPVARKKHR
jgi:hypothetical protein